MNHGQMSWQPRNTASSAQPKATRSGNCYHSSTTRRWSPSYQGTMRLTDHHVARIKRHLEPNTNPHYLAKQTEIQQLGDIHMTCDMIWKTKHVRQDPSMDHGGVPRCVTIAVRLNVTNIIMSGPITADKIHPSYVTTSPDIEAQHTPFASLPK